MKKKLTLLYALLLALSLILSGCQGDAGPAGTPGADGTSGSSGTTGPQGPVGQTGSTGTLPSDPFAVANFHGAANTVEATRGPNNAVNPVTEITGASINSDGKLVIDFKVTQSGAAFTTLASSAITFRFAQLRNGDSAGDSTYWVNYVNTKARKKPGYGFANNTGLEMNQPTGEAGNTTGGTWTNNNDGTYRYVTNKKLTDGITISYPPKAGTYAYDATLPHRVATQMADPDGTGSATMGANNAVYDFVPATGATVADPREIVVVANCNDACHKTLGLHGGGRLDTKLCVVCHNPTNGDPESGNILDFKVMVHKIHSAKYLPSENIDFAGEFNGLYNTDPEAAIAGTVNGHVPGTPYKIWGFNNAEHDFSEVLFPANPANCLMCHKNATKANNYKTVPTKEACGSCHDGINWTTGAGTRMWYPDSKITMGVSRTDLTGFATEIAKGHLPGVKTNAECATCHTSSGSQASADASPAPIPAIHGDFTNGWSKVETDYTIDLTLSAPANGTHYVAGEKPIATIVVKNAATGLPIDHTTISDASTSDFGSGTNTGNLYGLATAAGAAKGVTVNGTLNLYVSGPRALRKPALSTAAASKGFFSTTNNIYGNASNDLRIRTGTNKVLEDDYQLVNAVATPTKLTGVISRVDTAKIQYQLTDVTGLTSGTYVAFVHAAKKSSAGVMPKVMSLALKTFQVGTATEEKRVAFGCPDCHSTTMWHDNAVNGVPGNHPAKFDPDYCGNCHDYEAQQVPYATGGVTTYKVSLDSSGNEVFTAVILPAASGQVWKGGGNNMGHSSAPIGRRVHGVHFAKKANGTLGVNYPLEIYNGHNVSIVFPQDIKNCEKCHPAATTSGTWKTKPGRVACLACHDADATYAHALLNTYDPTPTITTAAAATTTPTSGPYTGDEIESCPVCHTPK